VAHTEHQSCLLLTSREKPSELIALEGSRTPIRALRLVGLDARACEHLLVEKDVTGTVSDQQRLIALYGGNPLAILREPVSLKDLLNMQATPLSRAQVQEALEALRRRSLIERGQRAGSFTLQSVVLDYATTHLIAEIVRETEQGRLSRTIDLGLELATAREYVRQTQTRLLLAPLLALLRLRYPGRGEVEQRLLTLLSYLREYADYAQGYGPANVLALLREQRSHLRGLDLSRLVIRGAYLQGVELQDTSLSGTLLQECVWTSTFDAIWAVAISRQQAGRSARVAREREDLAPGLAGAYRPYMGTRFQPGRTHTC
jgi:hypothetical protein